MLYLHWFSSANRAVDIYRRANGTGWPRSVWTSCTTGSFNRFVSNAMEIIDESTLNELSSILGLYLLFLWIVNGVIAAIQNERTGTNGAVLYKPDVNVKPNNPYYAPV